MDLAVVLVSGGINSAVTAALSAKEHALAMMHVSYGQRTSERELSCFNSLCKHFSPREKIVVPLPHIASVGGNARVSKDLPIHDAGELSGGNTSTYVPGLLPTMLGLAFHWSSAIGAKHITVGSSEHDGPTSVRTSALFPDHRREVYHLYNQLVELTARKEGRIAIHAPLIDMSRSEVIRLGDRTEVPFEMTWSCDRSATKPCGTCYGCVSRAHGFIGAAIPDPIMIEDR